MSRAKLSIGKQKEFLVAVQNKLNLKIDKLAEICKVHQRTFYDWWREKYKMNYATLLKLHKISKIPLPSGLEILPEYWSTKKAGKIGARRRYELYGNPGTPKGRRKGGLTTQRRLHFDAEIASKIKLKLRKNIRIPQESILLAEFIGIMLGDGGIRNDYQITISFNKEEGWVYANYIQKMIKYLFALDSSIFYRAKNKGADIVVSSKNLVEFLKRHNLQKGSKVTNGADVPLWIWRDVKYQVGCLRGLIDTDGCVYRHVYSVNNKKYSYIKMCFKNHSLPLLRSVKKMLTNLEFNPFLNRNTIYINTSDEVHKYFSEIGTHNQHHLLRYKRFVL